MGSEEFLIENIKEFTSQAKDSASKGFYNSAVTLRFKAIAVLTDLFILRTEGFIPKNHTERFQLLKAKHPKIYSILNKDFPVYQQSYRIKLTKEYAEVFENDLKILAEITKINI